jgi:hypothetical protein
VGAGHESGEEGSEGGRPPEATPHECWRRRLERRERGPAEERAAPPGGTESRSYPGRAPSSLLPTSHADDHALPPQMSVSAGQRLVACFDEDQSGTRVDGVTRWAHGVGVKDLTEANEDSSRTKLTDSKVQGRIRPLLKV